ncbi:hypothetical protein E8F20_20445 [Pseudomonas sp. BN415]|uniref:alginate O-acetyltransferase AlgX-related protein n=1 Tax=Pseudomonas sp. BN415 TaxID=2567889 RepID=UPI002456E89A|nr:hypothetical protein [Pseudomonas sp. BN415]MDH4584237.1 hypothetical protein [Pseudomonas sp. BN415]
MKKKLFGFLFAVMVSLLVVPVVNVLSVPDGKPIKWHEKGFLYNVDFVSALSSALLYPLGISTDPEQVVIGRDGWLYLGDKYENARSVVRSGASPEDKDSGKRIGEAAAAWETYLSSRGVRLYRVLVGPNKESIYPDYLPDWARGASPSAADVILAGAGSVRYVDLRRPLQEARKTYSAPLYYKTDTHWNQLGGAVAFQYFAEVVGADAPELAWPSKSSYQVSGVAPRIGGDLANFLRISSHLSDLEPTPNASGLPVTTERIDFNTSAVISSGGNLPVGSPSKPLLIRASGALNSKRVLWLRDSFGTAMSPLMAATFSEVLQLHWLEALKPGGNFVQLVESWRPDYVFITVVERSVGSGVFAFFPPPVVVPRGGDFKPTLVGTVNRMNDLDKGHSANEYKITGRDPFVEFSIANASAQSGPGLLNIDLTCNDGSVSAPIQIFWLGNDAPRYDEENSVRLTFSAGSNLIDLRTIKKLHPSIVVKRIRLDIDSKDSCRSFKLRDIVLGNGSGT